MHWFQPSIASYSTISPETNSQTETVVHPSLSTSLRPVRAPFSTVGSTMPLSPNILYYPKIGGENIKYVVKKAIRNLLHAKIDVHNRRLISEFPGDGVKCITKLQLHCDNITFDEKMQV